MPDRIYELDELTANLIAAQRVCPFLPDCTFIQNRCRTDQGTITFAIRYCGGTYDRCRYYLARLSEKESLANELPENPGSRDGPME